jgi:anti-sigma regulatory factor (Ser/Thr protein kinase)
MPATATFQVASCPESVAEARAAVTAAAVGRVDAQMLQTARLLVSELVTNGVVHGGGSALEVAVHIGDPGLRVEVTDFGGGFLGQPRSAGLDHTGGWGLFLVQRLSDRWGIERDGSTRVWFELDQTGSEAIWALV